MAGETADAPTRHPQRFGWVDAQLAVVCVGSTLVVLASLFAQVSFGTFSMTPERAWLALLDADVWYHPPTLLSFLLGEGLTETLFGLPASWEPHPLVTETKIVWDIRLPRVLVGAFAGLNLAISGAVFQAVTRNELASPYILGVSSGAGLAILLTLVVFGGFAAFLPLFAALGGATAFLIVYAIAWKGGTSPVRLVLAGVIVSTIFGSLQTGAFLLADDIGTVQTAIAWTTGSLTGTDWDEVRMIAPWTVFVVLPGVALAARQLNVLLLGERTASSLGMNVERIRFVLSAIAIVAASAAIAVAGIVGFVGLIVPHVVRTLVGSDHKRLLVGCLFVGPALLVAADVVARLGLQLLLGSSGQVPVGIVTGLVGGPYFLYLMRRKSDLGEI